MNKQAQRHQTGLQPAICGADGDLAFPKAWTLFGPVGKDDVEPEFAGMNAVPQDLTIAGKRLPPIRRIRPISKGVPPMLSEVVVATANACQLAVPIIALAAYLPQWTKIYRNRSSADISLRAWCLWTVSSAFALFHAVVQLLLNGRGWALVISSLLSVLFVVSTVALVVRFRQRKTLRS